LKSQKRQTHFINQNDQMQRSPFSAKTRSADDAEKIRQALKDSHDPDKVKIKQLEEANKQRDEAEAQKTVTIEEAVGRFLQYEHDHRAEHLAAEVEKQHRRPWEIITV
jgi:hypothetical protein